MGKINKIYIYQALNISFIHFMSKENYGEQGRRNILHVVGGVPYWHQNLHIKWQVKSIKFWEWILWPKSSALSQATYKGEHQKTFSDVQAFSQYSIHIHSLKKGGESLTNFSKQLIKNKMT